MENTVNYNLKKPGINDFYDVEDFNDNADIIDTALKSHDTQLAQMASYDEYESVNNQSIANDVFTNLLLTLKTTKGTKTCSSVNASGIFTITESGTYEIQAGVTFDTAGATSSFRQIVILSENGNPITLANNSFNSTSDNSTSAQIGSVQYLNAGDTFSVKVKQLSGSALSVLKGSTSRLKIRKVG